MTPVFGNWDSAKWDSAKWGITHKIVAVYCCCVCYSPTVAHHLQRLKLATRHCQWNLQSSLWPVGLAMSVQRAARLTTTTLLKCDHEPWFVSRCSPRRAPSAELTAVYHTHHPSHRQLCH